MKNLFRTLFTALCCAGLLLFTPAMPSPAAGFVTETYASPLTYTVSVDSGYLALRTAKAYDYRNEIGALYSGQTVDVYDTSDPTYWWVYAPCIGKYGYVNRNYLIGGTTCYQMPSYTYTYSTGFTRTVYVQSGYLALRTAKAYDYRNEIGALYSGETVQVLDTSEGTYWWVYAPSLGSYGYVNSNYLY